MRGSMGAWGRLRVELSRERWCNSAPRPLPLCPCPAHACGVPCLPPLPTPINSAPQLLGGIIEKRGVAGGFGVQFADITGDVW